MAYATTKFLPTSLNSISSNTCSLRRTRRTRRTSLSSVTFRLSRPSIRTKYTTTIATDETIVSNGSISLQKSSYYEILGLQVGATAKEIKAAYRKMARVVHPDVVVASKGDEFIKIHEAYETLSDPRKRADYDRTLWFKGRRLSHSPSYRSSMGTTKHGNSSYSGFSGYTRHSWESDQCW